MKIYIPTNPLWYFAVVVLIVPFFVVDYIHPVWVVRLVAFSALMVGVVGIGLYYILTLHKTIKEDAPLVKKYGKRPMIWVMRIFLITFIFLMALPTLPSLAKDVVATLKGDAPLTRTGIVVNREGGPLTGYFMEYIMLDDKYIVPENSFSAPYFPLRFFEIGKTYEILYTPNSHLILDAKLK